MADDSDDHLEGAREVAVAQKKLQSSKRSLLSERMLAGQQESDIVQRMLNTGEEDYWLDNADFLRQFTKRLLLRDATSEELTPGQRRSAAMALVKLEGLDQDSKVAQTTIDIQRVREALTAGESEEKSGEKPEE